MRTLYLYFLCAIILLSACEKTVDADKLLDTDEKVSITSYISPIDTLLRVKVSKALPAIGTVLSSNDSLNRQLFLIKDAVVNMSDGEGSTVGFSYSDNEETYIANAADLTISEGKQYFLTVEANGKAFSAMCTIPKRAPEIIENVRIITDEFENSIGEIDITFTDIIGERNFYVLGAFTEGRTIDGELFQTPLLSESDGFLTDAVQDGITLGETARIFLGEQGNPQPSEVTLQLAHIDETIYQNFQASNLNRENDGNPFIEFSIAPNNIQGEGGIGIFAGYQVTEKIITINP